MTQERVRWKSLCVKTGRSFTSYCHGQTGLNLEKNNLIYHWLKEIQMIKKKNKKKGIGNGMWGKWVVVHPWQIISSPSLPHIVSLLQCGSSPWSAGKSLPGAPPLLLFFSDFRVYSAVSHSCFLVLSPVVCIFLPVLNALSPREYHLGCEAQQWWASWSCWNYQGRAAPASHKGTFAVPSPAPSRIIRIKFELKCAGPGL